MKPCVLALGFFDGVHLGHGGLLKQARRVADQLHIDAAVLTFDRHPASVITGKMTPLLNTVSERKMLMKSLYKMDEVYILPFDAAMQNMSWQSFAESILIEKYHAVHVVCGHDYRFGAGGEGNAKRLQEFCAQNGMGFDCISEIRMDGQKISSTLIRMILEQGRVEDAARYLGHRHILCGTVVDGRKIGRTLGIPTANLMPEHEILLPKNGVYAAKASFDSVSYAAVVNIGVRPTFSGSSVTVEPWLLDFDGNLYGKNLCLEFYAFLREEQKFDSLDALKNEIHHNAEQTRELFANQ